MKRALLLTLLVVLAGCTQYESVTGHAYVLVEYGGVSPEGLDLSDRTLRIENKQGVEYSLVAKSNVKCKNPRRDINTDVGMYQCVGGGGNITAYGKFISFQEYKDILNEQDLIRVVSGYLLVSKIEFVD